MLTKYFVYAIVLAFLSGVSSDAHGSELPEELARWMKQKQAFQDDPSLVAYYDFQEGAGTSLKNKSKTGGILDGKIHNAQWVSGRWPGKNALRFDGAKSFVEIPSVKELCSLDREQGGSGELTVEVWLKADSDQEAGIVDKSSAGTASQSPFMIWISPHRLNSYVGQQSDNRLTNASDVEDILTQEWIHVAMVVDSKTLALYRDGVLLRRTPRNTHVSDNGKPLLIGSMGLPGRYFFDGLIDEVVIYNKALSQSVIKKHADLFPRATGPQKVELTSPLTRERWNADSLHHITWTASNVRKAELLQIEYSVDERQSWKIICTTPVNAQKYLWRVPNTVSDKCRVRLNVNNAINVGQQSGIFSIQPAPEIPRYEWKKVALPAAFAPRDGAGALVYQDQMWLLGGWNPPDKTFFPRGCNNEVWNSKNGADWNLVRPNTFIDSSFDSQQDWEGRHTAGYVVYQDKMWIIGGDANQGHYQFDVWNSSDGKSWNHVNKGKPVPWGPRVLHYTLVYKNKIWVIGGQSLPQFGGGKEAFYRDVWNTTDGIHWEQVTPQEPFWPQRGMIGGNVVFKDRMWILGGGTYDTPKVRNRKYFNDVWSSDDGVKWQSHATVTPWEPRQYHEIAAFDGRMWVLEGYAKGNRNDVWHSDDGVNWYELANTPWKPRHAASVYVFKNALWMIAGNNMQSDVWKLVRSDTSR